jgi:putative phosphoesterase
MFKEDPMKIAIMSDSHDNIWNIRKALETIASEGVAMIIHCGDYIAPFSLQELDHAGIPVHGVFGNNDGDQYLLTSQAFTILNNVTLHGICGNQDIDGKKIAFTHEYVKARGMTAEGNYDLVCYGHSHEHKQEEIDGVILLNPGEIMGKDGNPGFCIYDTTRGDIQRINI